MQNAIAYRTNYVFGTKDSRYGFQILVEVRDAEVVVATLPDGLSDAELLQIAKVMGYRLTEVSR